MMIGIAVYFTNGDGSGSATAQFIERSFATLICLAITLIALFYPKMSKLFPLIGPYIQNGFRLPDYLSTSRHASSPTYYPSLSETSISNYSIAPSHFTSTTELNNSSDSLRNRLSERNNRKKAPLIAYDSNSIDDARFQSVSSLSSEFSNKETQLTNIKTVKNKMELIQKRKFITSRIWKENDDNINKEDANLNNISSDAS